MTIRYICDESAGNWGKIECGEQDVCSYFMNINSAVACGGFDSGGNDEGGTSIMYAFSLLFKNIMQSIVINYNEKVYW